MVFDPVAIDLHEAGPGDPYGWLLTENLVWTGNFRGSQRELTVPASADHPFSTDLASVPRSLTWLFPRYGKYTKAAVLHDYLCQNFRSAPSVESSASLLPLKDRSDADEVFFRLMTELGVPGLRRALMWGAVSWATLITALTPGRRSTPVSRWIGRILVILAMLVGLFALIAQHDLTAVIEAAVAIPAAVIAGGTIALGRTDRILEYLAAFFLTMLFSPLLALGLVLGIALYAYFFVEDLFAGLPGTRRFIRDLFSKDAKLEKLGTAQFARLAAVMEG